MNSLLERSLLRFVRWPVARIIKNKNRWPGAIETFDPSKVLGEIVGMRLLSRFIFAGLLGLAPVLLSAQALPVEPSSPDPSRVQFDPSEPGLESIYAYSGKYVFRIDARNRSFQPLHQGFATASVAGNVANIWIRADGYQDAHTTVFLRDNQTNYSAQVTMRDPSMSVDVRDENSGAVSARFREENFSVPAYRYRFAGTLQGDGFTKFKAQDVKVRVNGLSSFGARVRVYPGANPKLEITLDRRDLRKFSNRIEIQIPSDSSFPDQDGTRAHKFALLYQE